MLRSSLTCTQTSDIWLPPKHNRRGDAIRIILWWHSSSPSKNDLEPTCKKLEPAFIYPYLWTCSLAVWQGQRWHQDAEIWAGRVLHCWHEDPLGPQFFNFIWNYRMCTYTVEWKVFFSVWVKNVNSEVLWMTFWSMWEVVVTCIFAETPTDHPQTLTSLGVLSSFNQPASRPVLVTGRSRTACCATSGTEQGRASAGGGVAQSAGLCVPGLAFCC